MNSMRLNDYPPEKLQAARDVVADFWEDNARKLRNSDDYGLHITDDQKGALLVKSLRFANRVRAGIEDHNFTVYQRLIFELSGESPALLPK